MRVTVEEIGAEDQEEIILRCHKIDDAVLETVRRLERLQTGLVGYHGGEIHRLSFRDVYYFEVVDNRAFFYCAESVYESRMRLYEFEELCHGTAFFRASKSMVLNADKIDYIAPSLSGRFEVTLLNGEKVMVSRQYVRILKRMMGLC